MIRRIRVLCLLFLLVGLTAVLGSGPGLANEAEIPLPEGAVMRLGMGWIGRGDRAVAFSPDGKHLAVAASIGVWLWDTKTWEPVKLLYGHTKPVRSIAFSPDGKYLASGSDDYTVKLWDVRTGECIRTLEGHEDQVLSVAFSPDGKLLASGGGRGDRRVKLWDVTTGREVRTLGGHISRVYSVAFSPDGKCLASGSWDKTVKLWDIETGECIRTLEGHSDVNSVAFSPDGKYLASGSNDYTVKLWNPRTGECIRTLAGHTCYVRSVAFSPDGKLLASGSWDHTVKLWDVRTGECIRTLEGHIYWVDSVAFSPDGRFLASGSWDKTVKLWDIETGECMRTLRGSDYDVVSVAFSPDGRLLAADSEYAGRPDNIQIWDVATGECIRTLEGHIGPVWSVAFSPDGRLLASGSWDETVKLWEVATGECIRTLEGHKPEVRRYFGFVHSVAFSPNRRLLASGSEDHTVKLWNVRTGRCVRTLEGHTSWVYSVAFSPDGEYLASGSWDGTVLIWAVLQPQPKIVSIDFPGSIWTRVEAEGTISFRDPDGDLARARFEVLEGHLEGFALDLTRPPYASQVQGKTEGSFDFTVEVEEPGTYRLRITLVDGEGNESEPREFSFTARTPTPPSIVGLSFPELLALGAEGKGTLEFSDPDGDIARARFEVLEGELEGFTLDLTREPYASQVQGKTGGSFEFTLAPERTGVYRLWVTLVDSAGLESEPREFSFRVAGAPEITGISFPQVVEAGTEAEGEISFHDPEGDLAQARVHVLQGNLADFTLDLTKPPYASQVRGKAEGAFTFTLKVEESGTYRIQVTLVDAAGLESAPVEFSFRAAAAPRIVKVVFPKRIAVGEERNGLVKFEDPEGDITTAEFEILEGDPATIELKPALSFDPGVRGRTQGSFRFSVVVHKAQTVTLRLTLLDATGLRSEPYEFTFQVE